MPFLFVPGAISYGNHGGLAIYIKYGKFPNTITLKEINPHYIWIQLPDRELFLTRDNHTTDSSRPLDENFDEVVCLGAFFDSFPTVEIPSLMVNYVESMKQIGRRPNHRKDGVKRGVTVTSDSGGFQILTGRANLLDPKDIAEYYNDNVDQGMVLDIPASTKRRELLYVLANIQKKNTDRMLEFIKPHVELFNVFHGLSVEETKRFRAIVETDKISTAVGIGSTYFGSAVQRVSDALTVMLDGHAYKKYHILGIFNTAITPMIIRMANSDLGYKSGIPLITTDASTHVHSGNARKYWLFRDVDQPMSALVFGLNGSTPPAINTARHLPCSCPVCSAIKYADVFAILPGETIRNLLIFHNMFSMVNYNKVMDNYAKELNFEDYRRLVYSQLRNHSLREETDIGLKFLEEVLQTNLIKAKAKYSAWTSAGGMFRDMNMAKIHDEKGNVVPENKLETRMDNLIQSYTSFQSNFNNKGRMSTKGKSLRQEYFGTSHANTSKSFKIKKA